jgi:hypothetical protein
MNDEVTTLGSRIAYENRWLRVREDRIRRRDGSEGLYGVVERSDFVIVVPVQDGRRIARGRKEVWPNKFCPKAAQKGQGMAVAPRYVALGARKWSL